MPSAAAPLWPYCGHGAAPVIDPVGCRGICIPGHSKCLAHLSSTDRATYLASLSAGADVDHRGTPFTERLLAQLLNAMRDQTTGGIAVGRARFDGAKFSGEADFADVTFTGRAEFFGSVFDDYGRFKRARFEGRTLFLGAVFPEASFEQAVFEDSVHFTNASFQGEARFSRVECLSTSSFARARFNGDAKFDRSTFAKVSFTGATFATVADFSDTAFGKTPSLGPLVCTGTIDLEGAVFEAPVTLEIAAAAVDCQRTRWDATAELRLRHADLHLHDAVLTAPTAVTTHATPFSYLGLPLPEAAINSREASVHVTSVQGVDASHLVLTDTDLADCRFTGAFHLDQIHIEGRTTFAPVPKGLHLRGRIWPVRCSQRRTLAEEHHWRAQVTDHPAIFPQHPPTERSWRTGPHHGDPAHTPDPEDIAAVYRQLRKAFEDAKNEPGAADFYYGEMEMRRHSRDDTSRSERALLHGYWLLSGYGLRASRALGWLAAAMLATVLLLMGFGLPQRSPAQEATGTVPAGGGRVTFTLDKDDPQNPTGNRFTGKRFDQALTVTLNSVIFRSSGTDLTTTGTYTEMASRLLEPALLALAVLAVRGRIKR
ncbi:pentapeptide repeat-containing protein [Streptomyces sp. NPDC090493]|uniref:pentapeptide repeat-containing protein n=1 Tax=Streptomyces sp. NPDC090493 TaxID=3365964 RepID=UPI003805301D